MSAGHRSVWSERVSQGGDLRKMAFGGPTDSSQSDDFVDLAVKRPCLRDPPPKLKDNDIIEVEEEELEDIEEEEDEDDVQILYFV